MSPKIPDPPAPPAPIPSAPPPTKTAKVVENKGLKARQTQKKRGASALRIRRSSVGMNSSGTGSNISY